MKYNKLVRDKIPAIIEKTGKKCIVRVADPSEINDYLFKKLQEEIEELKNTNNIEDLLEEVADITSVLREICNINGVSFADSVIKQIAKETERGSFKKHIILVEVLGND